MRVVPPAGAIWVCDIEQDGAATPLRIAIYAVASDTPNIFRFDLSEKQYRELVVFAQELDQMCSAKP